MSTTKVEITREQLRQFFERTQKAEQLALALSNKLNDLPNINNNDKSNGISPNIKNDVIQRVLKIKDVVAQMEIKIKNVM